MSKHQESLKTDFVILNIKFCFWLAKILMTNPRVRTFPNSIAIRSKHFRTTHFRFDSWFSSCRFHLSSGKFIFDRFSHLGRFSPDLKLRQTSVSFCSLRKWSLLAVPSPIWAESSKIWYSFDNCKLYCSQIFRKLFPSQFWLIGSSLLGLCLSFVWFVFHLSQFPYQAGRLRYGINGNSTSRGSLGLQLPTLAFVRSQLFELPFDLLYHF